MPEFCFSHDNILQIYYTALRLDFGRTSYIKLGRLKLDWKKLHFFSRSFSIISIFTFYVTVAVNPKIGIFGKNSFSADKFSYSFLNSLPHVDTQCTSSMIMCCKHPLW
jgi:hypothetical protein